MRSKINRIEWLIWVPSRRDVPASAARSRWAGVTVRGSRYWVKPITYLALYR